MSNRRRLYERFTPAIVEHVSLSSRWRRRIFDSNFGTEFEITGVNDEGMDCELGEALRKHELVFFVSKVPHSQTIGWEGYEGYVMFRFRAAEFPDICSFSANNPDSI